MVVSFGSWINTWDPSFQGFPSGSAVKNLPAMQEMRAQSLGREDPLEKERATNSSTFAWEIPWTEEPDGLQSKGSRKNLTWLSNSTNLLTIRASLWLSWWRIHLQCKRPRFNSWVGKIPGKGNGYPLQYCGLENLMDCYSPWGCKESDMTERPALTLRLFFLWYFVL